MLLQLAVLVKNQPRELAKVMRLLAENQINCLGLSTYEAADFGSFHMIVDKPQECKEVLTQAGYPCVERYCIGVELEDQPGRMDALLTTLSQANVNIDCIFTIFNKNTNRAVLIFRADDTDAVEEHLIYKEYNVVRHVTDLC